MEGKGKENWEGGERDIKIVEQKMYRREGDKVRKFGDRSEEKQWTGTEGGRYSEESKGQRKRNNHITRRIVFVKIGILWEHCPHCSSEHQLQVLHLVLSTYFDG